MGVISINVTDASESKVSNTNGFYWDIWIYNCQSLTKIPISGNISSQIETDRGMKSEIETDRRMKSEIETDRGI